VLILVGAVAASLARAARTPITEPDLP
jgi:hypothetical protein